MAHRILVTGGAGFIGSHVVDRCLEQGHTVCVYDNFSVGHKEHLPTNKNLSIIEGDLLDEKKLSQALDTFKPTHVIHMAALHYIPYCNAHPLETVDVNIKGTEQLLQCLSMYSGPLERVSLASSAAVYAPSEDLHQEEHEMGPTDIYGISKMTNEMQGRKFHSEKGVPTTLMRIFNAYGNRETNPHLIPEIVSQLKNGVTSVELGNVTTKRSYIFVKDLANGICLLSEQTDPGVNVYNIGSHAEYNAQELVELLVKLAKKPITINSVASRQRKSDRPRLHPNLNKIEKLGWKEEYNIEKGLQEIIDTEL